MTLTRYVTVIAMAATLTASRPLVALNGTDGSPFEDVRVESVALSDIDSEGVRVVLYVTARARTSATLEYVVIDQASIGSVKVNLLPMPGPIRMQAGDAIDRLPPLQARVSYRDLESLEALRQIVREGHARVRGTLRGRLALNLFQKLALMTTGAWVITPLDHEVPVEFPGGALGQLAATAALTIAEPVWSAGRAWRARADAPVLKRAQDAIEGSLFSIETRYQVRSRSGEAAQVTRTTTGFLVDERTVLTPAEAVEPWQFDNGVAEAIQKGEVSIDVRGVEIHAIPIAPGVAPARGFSLQQQQLRLVKLLTGSDDVISTTAKRGFRMRLRARDGNAAILAVSGWAGTAIPIDVAPPTTEWKPATIARVRRLNDRVEPLYWQTAVRWDGQRYEIRDAVDRDAFGSPIWTETGVIALVQDDASGAALDRLLDRLGQRRSPRH